MAGWDRRGRLRRRWASAHSCAAFSIPSVLVLLLGNSNVVTYAGLCIAALRWRRAGATADPGWRMPWFPAPPIFALVFLLIVAALSLFTSAGRSRHARDRGDVRSRARPAVLGGAPSASRIATRRSDRIRASMGQAAIALHVAPNVLVSLEERSTPMHPLRRRWPRRASSRRIGTRAGSRRPPPLDV